MAHEHHALIAQRHLARRGDDLYHGGTEITEDLQSKTSVAAAISVSRHSGRHTTSLLLAATALLLLAGCRADMQNQPYKRPLAESDFYADKRSARPLVEGTVARTDLRADTYFYTGKIGKDDGDYMPFPVTAEVLKRGQQRFNIYCSPCHGETGDGQGMIVQRGLKRPPSYHNDRLRKEPIGYFFDVMTNGFGVMLDYSQQVKPEDRWAIAAYIRALQLSQSATRADVPAGQQIAAEPPAGVVIAAPYDTQGTTPQGSAPVQGGPQ